MTIDDESASQSSSENRVNPKQPAQEVDNLTDEESLEPAKRAKLRWRKLRSHKGFWPIAFGLPALVIMGIALAIYLPWELSKVVVPDLTGKTLPEAREAVQDIDADLELETQGAPSRSLEDFWEVLVQEPPAGERVVPGSAISIGGELIEVTVPELTRLTALDDAEALLEGFGLSGEVRMAYVDASDIPEFEGISDDELSQFLETHGIVGDANSDGEPFAVSVSSKYLSSEMATVVIPSNVSGTRVRAGSSVDLVLIPPIAVVPNVVGMSVSSARETLANTYVMADFGSSEDWFTVRSQNLPAGSLMMIGAGKLELETEPARNAFSPLSTNAWAQIAKNPNANVGKRAIVYGEVVQFDVNTGACAFRMQTGPVRTQYSYEYRQNTYVRVAPGNCDLLDPVVQDDHLKAWVVVTGAYTYSTSIGGSATALEVEIWHFEKLPKQRY